MPRSSLLPGKNGFFKEESGDASLEENDVTKHYFKNQDRWRAYCAETIDFISDTIEESGGFPFIDPEPLGMRNGSPVMSAGQTKFNLEPGETPLERLFQYCANRRMKIAIELKHGKDVMPDNFGMMRESKRDSSHEKFIRDDREQAWTHQKDTVFRFVDSMLQAVPSQTDGVFVCDDYKVESECGGSMLSITPSSDDDYAGDNNPLIGMMKSKSNRKNDSIIYQYPLIEAETRAKNLIKGDAYYQAMLACDTSNKEGQDEFLKASGKFMHFMANLLLVKRGNAAICEWIFKGVAKKKGLEIGKFNQGKGELSWDMHALMTPGREKYADWFHKNAILEMESIPISSASQASKA